MAALSFLSSAITVLEPKSIPLPDLTIDPDDRELEAGGTEAYCILSILCANIGVGTAYVVVKYTEAASDICYLAKPVQIDQNGNVNVLLGREMFLQPGDKVGVAISAGSPNIDAVINCVRIEN